RQHKLGYTPAMGESTSPADKAQARLRKALPDLEAIYLFGSRAQARAREDSDYDLAILCASPVVPLHVLELERELSTLLDRDVDLVDLRRSSSVLKKEVIESGERLYAREVDLALDFEARALT